MTAHVLTGIFALVFGVLGVTLGTAFAAVIVTAVIAVPGLVLAYVIASVVRETGWRLILTGGPSR